jgi:hypothetical protein
VHELPAADGLPPTRRERNERSGRNSLALFKQLT